MSSPFINPKSSDELNWFKDIESLEASCRIDKKAFAAIRLLAGLTICSASSKSKGSPVLTLLGMTSSKSTFFWNGGLERVVLPTVEAHSTI